MATAAEVLQNVRRHGVQKQLADDRIELLGELQEKAAAVGNAERDLLRTVVRCDNAELWRDDDCRSTADWLAQRIGTSRWKALTTERSPGSARVDVSMNPDLRRRNQTS